MGFTASVGAMCCTRIISGWDGVEVEQVMLADPDFPGIGSTLAERPICRLSGRPCIGAEGPQLSVIRDAIIRLNRPGSGACRTTVKFECCALIWAVHLEHELDNAGAGCDASRVKIRFVPVLRPSADNGARWRDLFGLTMAEARVADMLRIGMGDAAIAQQLGTSILTVRTQVKSIYQKTEMRSRGALAHLLTALSVPPG